MNKRLNAKEQGDLIELAAALTLINGIGLQERISSAPGGARDFGLLKSLVSKTLSRVFATVPLEQLKRIKRQFELIEISSGVRGVGASDADKKYGRFVSHEDLRELIKGCSDKCDICDKSAETRRNCKLRKALNALPVDHEICLDDFDIIV